MYVIYSSSRNAYKTYDGWTTITGGAMVGLSDVIRFTKREKELWETKRQVPKGWEFRYFPPYTAPDWEKEVE